MNNASKLPPHFDQNLRFKRFLTSSDLGKTKQNDQGENLCVWCEAVIQKPRRRWCSDACVEEFNIRASGSVAANAVYERDKGICQLCGVDAQKLLAHAFPYIPKHHWIQSRESYKKFEDEIIEFAKGIEAARKVREEFPWLQPGMSNATEIDHIIPVVEGGGCCGLDNLRTLCRQCHLQETRKLRERLKAKQIELKEERRLEECGGVRFSVDYEETA